MGDTYADLIERLGKATGPDRELDAEIAIAIFETVHTDDDLVYAHRRDPGNDATHPGHYFIKSRSGAQAVGAAFYTASIDAAIPEEDIVSVVRQKKLHDGQEDVWWVAVHEAPRKGEMTIAGRGRTEALARRIAALRAKQSLSDGA